MLLASSWAASLLAPQSLMVWVGSILAVQLGVYWLRHSVFPIAAVGLLALGVAAWRATTLAPLPGSLFNLVIGAVMLMLTAWLTWAHGREHLERQQLIEDSPVGLIVVDPATGRIEMENRKIREIFRYDPGELRGQPIETLVPDRLRHDHSQWRSAMQPTPIPHLMANAREIVGRTRDGHEVFVQIILSSWSLRGKARVMGAVTDVTIRHQLEEISNRLEYELRAFVDSIPAAVYMKRADGRYLMINRLFGELFHIAPDAVVGKTDYDLFPEATADIFRQNDRRVIETREEVVIEEAVPQTDGLHQYTSIKFPLINQKGELYATAGISMDVTERVRTQQQLALYARELERSNEDLQQFAYVASHDLQEPLRMVSGYCHLLAARYKGRLDADADDFLQFATEGAERMKHLVDDLLAYSRLGSLPSRLTDVDLAAVVSEAIRNLQLVVKESGATIDVGPLPQLRGDHVRLVQLFQNLLSNALKFVARTPPVVRIEARPDGERWRFAVIDNGIGFDNRQAERIFLMFRRLHARGDYPGTGIGLALCRRIVEQHGGRIWAESMPGQGSTFHFTLASSGGPS